MFVAAVTFMVNLATALLLFLVSIGNLTTGRFFTTFHFLKVSYTATNGPNGGWLSTPYNVLTFGLWNYCEGMDNVINACIEPKVEYNLSGIQNLNDVDLHYVANAVRSVNKVAVLYIPATALSPRFRKRWLHAISGFFMLLVTLSCILLMMVVLAVNVSRKVQFEKHLVPDAKVSLGPGVWITLALVPLTVFGTLLNGFAVCCPGRLQRRPKSAEDFPADTKAEIPDTAS
ncbi:hypothetical protein EDD11_008306 [Mortierella claussenii]|nr:hypothetical protein EDD11_008306 [Mortierella claussenii]